MRKKIKCYNCSIDNPKVLAKCFYCGFYMCQADKMPLITPDMKNKIHYMCLDCNKLKLDTHKFKPGIKIVT